MRSLSGQFALYAFLLFVMIALCLGYWSLSSYRHYGEEVEQRLHSDLALHIVKDNQKLSEGVIDTGELKGAFHTMMLLGPDWEIYALDPGGKILAYSAPPEKIQQQRVSLVPIQASFEQAEYPLYGDDPRSPESQRIFSVAPIKDPSGQLKGYLYVIIGGEQWRDLSQMLNASHVLQDGARLLFGALVFGGVLLFLLFVLLTRPLRSVIGQIKDFVAAGFKRNPGQNPVSHSFYPAEVKALEHSFDEMAQHIEDQLQRIKSTDEVRRELLSHVSHDLRTPLASLQGYLETWLLQKEDARQPELIQIALKNAQQLNVLVDQLFELARLEGGEIRFEPEPVAVSELAYDVVQRMGLQARSHGVHLEVDCDHNQLQVVADIGKLERILVNLIDNALRHTPEGGEVRLAIEQEQLRACIRVADTGCGIEQAELPRIFEPHYRTQSSIDRKVANTGLGLAIVVKLVHLHGSQVEVTSQPEQGTEFSFHLPLAS